ncbi:MAG: CHAT domain-containing tetratricopeptide repeat protein [Saprospiraceae bacterium]|nr:CHAT domain-containing tetratricopeptide repeat protein [Saprospiraceae bacterium]MDZ4703308.1 CHAT domain-containing tetratricopeptide repeat protein [Saprospiraceae bacterium]
MKFTSLVLFALCALPGFAANIDTLIVKSVAQADSLRSIGQADKALNLLMQVRQDRAFKNASCLSQSLLYHKTGVCHYMLDHYREALNYWRDTSLQIRLACLGKNHKETANSYYAVAMAYRYLGDKKTEGKYVRDALMIMEALPEKDLQTLAQYYLQAGYLFATLEDYGQALNYYEQSERLYSNLPDLEDNKKSAYLAEIKKHKGLSKAYQGKGKEAVRDLFAAIEWYKKTEGSIQTANIGQCYQNLSIAYAEISDYANAEKYGQMAIKINRTLSNPIESSHNYESLGRIKKRQGRYAEALNYFQQSLNIRLSARNQKLISNAYENIADVYAEQQDFARAMEHYQLAVTYLTPGQKRQHEVPAVIAQQNIVDRSGLLRVTGLQARCLHQQFSRNNDRSSLEKAHIFFRTYDTLHIQIRQQYKETSSKYWLMQTAMPVYEEAIGTALQLYRLSGEKAYLEEAYLYSAKGKAAVLLEGLQELDAKLNGIPSAVFAKGQSIQDTYSKLEQQFFETLPLGNERLLDSLRNALFTVRQQYNAYTEELEAKYPAYFQLKYALPNAASVEALRKKLPADAVILEYFIGKNTIYIFKISKAGIECFETAKPADFEQSCFAFRKLSDGSLPFDPGQYTLVGNALFEVLLAKPLQGLNPAINRLIIIPDNLLLQLSFDVLPYQVIAPGDGENLPYLIKKYAISISYSNQLIFGEKVKRRRAKRYGGFGLEYDDFTLEGFKSLNIPGDSVLKKRSAGRLPNSDDEVAEIADLLNGDAWINEKATKSAFYANSPDYRILHLAMHGIIDEAEPLNSALIFSREKDGNDDFILRATEVYNFSFQAEMAVLSACNTGKGELTPEGVRSLARAFTYAGCPSLVGSLWYAYDEPSREILVAFYRHLKTGKPKDVALQLAKMDYLQNASPTYTLPEYWSNLVVIGDPEALDLGTGRTNWLLVLGGIALAGLVLVGYKRFL